MATLEKIRKRGPLVAGIIGFALLAFIAGDIFTSSSRWGSKSQFEMAKISGESVQYQEFQAKIDEITEVYKLRTGQAVGDDMVSNFRSQVWEEILNKYVMDKEYAKLGIDVDNEELKDMVVGKNIDPIVQQLFTNQQTGQFDPNNVAQFIQNMDQDSSGNSKKIWVYFENQIYQRRKYSKYTSLISKSLNVTKLESKLAYQDNHQFVDIIYTMKNYSTIPDSTIVPTEEELKKWYEDHKKQYVISDETRDIDYVTFDIVPSKTDIEMIEKDIASYQSEFSQTKENELFIGRNSDTPFNSQFHKKGELSPIIDSFVFSKNVGDIYGPYRDGDMFKIVKIDSIISVADSVKARHILIAKDQTTDAKIAKTRADSILAAIKKGAKFDEMAKKFSKDPGSAAKGGDLGYFKSGMMVKPFEEACFGGKKGDIVVVETDFGAHVIEVQDKAALVKKVRIASMERRVGPSDQTRSDIYNTVSQFIGTNSTAESFEKAAKEKKYNLRIAPNLRAMDNYVPGLDMPRELIRMAFKAKKGEIILNENDNKNPIFDLINKYVVAKVKTIRSKGIPEFETVKEDLKFEVIKDIKAKRIIAEIEKSMAGKSIDMIATDWKARVDTAKTISFSSVTLPNAGMEPSVIGTAIVMDQMKISKPIKGNMGVFVFQIISVTKPADGLLSKQEMETIQRDYSSRGTYMAYEALKKICEIEDSRSKFY